MWTFNSLRRLFKSVIGHDNDRWKQIKPLLLQTELNQDLQRYLHSNEIESLIQHNNIDFSIIKQLIMTILSNLKTKMCYIDEECAKMVALTQFISCNNDEKSLYLFIFHFIGFVIIISNKLLTKNELKEVYIDMNLLEIPSIHRLFNYFDDINIKYKYYQNNNNTHKTLLPYFNYIESLTQNTMDFIEAKWYSFCYDIAILSNNTFYSFGPFLQNIIKKHYKHTDDIVFEIDKLILNTKICIDTEMNEIKLRDSIRKFYGDYNLSSDINLNGSNFLDLLRQIKHHKYDDYHRLQHLLSDLIRIQRRYEVKDEYYVALFIWCDVVDCRIMQYDVMMNITKNVFDDIIIKYNLLHNIECYVYILTLFGSFINILVQSNRYDCIYAIFGDIYPVYFMSDKIRKITLKQLKYEYVNDKCTNMVPLIQHILRRNDVLFESNIRHYHERLIAINHRY